eukprot:CAMPEP_0170529440 /NCGR_PEP_ID=MMETSP0209-20121228/23014_1 /TAXON_ID=665100 ORGANISM="Litonotus pictus, Strain P1" /NCGR_SAMPLE_ID=MMETSP0209 /ASSEMBLY_ACC=CAM_ASM_000301 /LENGTH=242 /DNA_ID=CAMNT_0010821411 /DNA_START=18 /DNA_END=746 /DNA_ORIENTATION=+
MIRSGEKIEAQQLLANKERFEKNYKKLGFPEIHSEDFMPELKQEYNINDIFYRDYVCDADVYRLYLPLRVSFKEENTKYLAQIIKAVNKYTPHLQNENEPTSLEDIRFKDVIPFLGDILAECASDIYLSEHRVRYQAEQTLRLKESQKCFNSTLYRLRRKSAAQFVLDYNNFLWNQIDKSHGNIDHKIPYNRIGHYTTETSHVDKFIFGMYFQTCSKLKKTIGQVLASAYKNPKKDTRPSLI